MHDTRKLIRIEKKTIDKQSGSQSNEEDNFSELLDLASAEGRPFDECEIISDLKKNNRFKDFSRRDGEDDELSEADVTDKPTLVEIPRCMVPRRS